MGRGGEYGVEDAEGPQELTLLKRIFRRTHVKYYNGMKKMFRQGVSAWP